MKSTGAIAVASHSFSKNEQLRRELTQKHASARFNETGRPLAGDELVGFLQGHEKAITGLEIMNDEVFGALPELRLVSKYGGGLDTIDLDAARRHGVAVRWTPGVNSQAVAELALAFMIALGRNLLPLAADVRAGKWPHHRIGRQLSSAIVGVLGCGNVGQRVARLCRAVGATVLAHDIRDYDRFYSETGVKPVSLALLLREADIVTIHLPLDRSTRGLIGSAEIATMKPAAFLVNTARGGIVDEEALADALAAHRLGGAALDVFATEPPSNSTLLLLPNVIATPHVGGGTEEAVLAMGRAAMSGLEEGHETIDLTRS